MVVAIEAAKVTAGMGHRQHFRAGQDVGQRVLLDRVDVEDARAIIPVCYELPALVLSDAAKAGLALGQDLPARA